MARGRVKCFFVLFSITLLLSLHSCSCRGYLDLTLSNSKQQHEHAAALFIFGDSLFDAGNNNYFNTTAHFQANFFPYGETFFNFPTGRFSNGRLIPDFIAEFADLPLILPYFNPDIKNHFNGVNFASAGAGALVDTSQGLVVDLKTQLSFFNKVEGILRKQLGNAKTKALLSKAVFFFSIGSNDYAAPFSSNTSLYQSQSPKEYVDLVIGNLTTVIEGIHNKGGRKFAFLNVGLVGCLPSVKALILQGKDECFEEITQLANLHNEKLSKTLQKLEKKFKGFMYSYVDFNNASVEIASNPAKYGLKEVKAACCGSGPFRGVGSCGGRRGIKEYQLCDNPDEYLLFDSSHLTERANQLIAKLIWSGNSNFIRPLNIEALFNAESGATDHGVMLVLPE